MGLLYGGCFGVGFGDCWVDLGDRYKRRLVLAALGSFMCLEQVCVGDTADKVVAWRSQWSIPVIHKSGTVGMALSCKLLRHQEGCL